MNNNIQKMGEIGANELVFNTDEGSGVFSGGFNVNSIMMKSGLSPIMTMNTHQSAGGDSSRVSDLFESLVIPNWALTYGGDRYKQDDREDEDEDEDEEIDDELHDKLLGLVREHDNKLKQKQNRQTKKQKQNQKQNIKKSGTRKRR